VGPSDDRRAWLFPSPPSHLDPDQEEDREALIRAEHPDLVHAIDEDVDEIEVGAEPTNPRLHLLMHALVANQLWHDDPPEMWATARRLTAGGYERHEVLHMLGSVVVGELWQVMQEVPYGRERVAAALDALPGSWEAQRSESGEDGFDDDDDDGGDGFELELPPAGITFTHRLTAAEAEGGFVAWSPDLEPLDPLMFDHGHLHLVGGEVAEPQTGDDGGRLVVGPPGWLGPCQAGGLVGFRVSDDEEVEVLPVTSSSVPEGWCRRLEEVYDDADGAKGLPIPVAELVNGALADARQPFVLSPVGGLLAGCGFEVRDGYAAREGADWDAFGRVRGMAAVAYRHGLDIDGARGLVGLCALYRAYAAGEWAADRPGDHELLEELAVTVADTDFGRAFVEAVLGDAPGPETGVRETLGGFVEALERRARAGHRGGLVWVRSVIARHGGGHDEAEALLRQALSADPRHPGALWDAAWYASDRGDGRRALALLRRLEESGDEEECEERAQALRRYANPPVALAGRNDSCPCGSGRKYKHCCLGAPRQAPLPDRVGWIWEKLDWFLYSSGFAGAVEDRLDNLGYGSPLDQLLAASLVLFEDGAVQEFLRQRGPVLPADEYNLVTQWSLTERSVHEVVSVDRGVGVSLRDIRTGDLRVVRERRGSTQLDVADLVCAHVVPDGLAYQIVGELFHVPLWLRDPLVNVLDSHAGGSAVASLVSAAASPPEMLTSEGEPIVLCEARYRLSDAGALRGLDAQLDADGGDRWSEPVQVGGRTWVRGTVSVEGDELVVSANSRARFARLQETVMSAVPGLEPVAERIIPAADAMARRGGGLPPPFGPVDSAEAAEALDAFIRQEEERWVDEPVPALEGLTPRQAAADPTRRKELLALLHEFDRLPAPPGAATFDVARLRALLGLDA